MHDKLYFLLLVHAFNVTVYTNYKLLNILIIIAPKVRKKNKSNCWRVKELPSVVINAINAYVSRPIGNCSFFKKIFGSIWVASSKRLLNIHTKYWVYIWVLFVFSISLYMLRRCLYPTWPCNSYCWILYVILGL